MRRLWLVVAVLAAALQPAPARAADGCATGAPPAWFLAAVYDGEAETSGEPREDFIRDVDNYETFLDALRATYCIPSTNSKILAFDNGFTHNGRTYDTASEGNLKGALRAFGPQARQTPDATFFFFLSSHGSMWGGHACAGGRRAAGSLSGLKTSVREDGTLYDCELGAELNTHFGDTKMAVFVDCSFCGGFSDSLTAVSGTIADGSVPVPSGILGPNRIVHTGCAVTTECFGGDQGAEYYGDLIRNLSVADCDGYTAPYFPDVQGIDLAERSGPRDGRCTDSELHFAAVAEAVGRRDILAIQEQYRIKYGPSSLDDDIRFL